MKIKNYIKTFSLFLFVILSCVLLGGCSAEYNITLKASGLIETNISIDLSLLTDSTKRGKVTNALKEYFNQLDKAFEENTVALYSNIYNLDDPKLENNEQKTAYILARNGFIVNDSEVEEQPDNKKINFKKSFYSINGSLSRSLTAYYLYFYPSALKYDETSKDIVLSASYENVMDDIPLSSNLQLQEGAFIAKYVQTANPLYYNGEEPKYLYDFSGVTRGTPLKKHLQDITGVSEETLNLVFNFTTPYKRVHSNADSINGGYTHTWKLGSVDSQIIFYRNMARPLFWYVIAGGVGIIIIAVGLITGYVIRNKKKRVGLDALKKINELANK